MRGARVLFMWLLRAIAGSGATVASRPASQCYPFEAGRALSARAQGQGVSGGTDRRSDRCKNHFRPGGTVRAASARTVTPGRVFSCSGRAHGTDDRTGPVKTAAASTGGGGSPRPRIRSQSLRGRVTSAASERENGSQNPRSPRPVAGRTRRSGAGPLRPRADARRFGRNRSTIGPMQEPLTARRRGPCCFCTGRDAGTGVFLLGVSARNR
jgi:hypothetical protein